MMISKFLDGITDVFMGNIIDRTHSRMGKARFWYFVSSFPVAFFTFLLFNVPKSFDSTGKYAYIFIVYTLMGAVFYTMNNIAYSSMTALCTRNPKDRVQMGSYRFVFALIAVLVIQSITGGLVEKFGGGQGAWTKISIIYSTICFVLLLVPVISVHELPVEELEAENNQKTGSGEQFGFVASIRILLKNKYFLMVLGIYLVNYIVSGLTQGLGIYFAAYKLGNPALLGAVSMASTVPLLVALPLIAPLTAKAGIRKTVIAATILGIVASVPLLIGGLTGNLPLLLAGLAVKSVSGAPMTGALNALIAETDDYSYLKFGHRITGMIYSCSSVGIKVGTGVGTAFCGFLLDLSGFDGTATVQSAGTIAVINWTYLLAYMLPGFILLLIFCFLNVESDNKKLREMKGV